MSEHGQIVVQEKYNQIIQKMNMRVHGLPVIIGVCTCGWCSTGKVYGNGDFMFLVRVVVSLESNVEFTHASSNENETTTWDISVPENS